MSKYYVCTGYRCAWIGTLADALTAPHPFDAEDTVVGCPECKGIDTLREKCDVEGCTERAAAWGKHDGVPVGVPIAEDRKWYRRCHEHREEVPHA